MNMHRLFAGVALLAAAVACAYHSPLPLGSRTGTALRAVGAADYPGAPVHIYWAINGRTDAEPIVAAALQPGDYIQLTQARKYRTWLAIVGGWSHVFSSGQTAETGTAPPPHSMQYSLNRYCPTGQVQIYDNEHGNGTPRNEELDPTYYMLSGSQVQTAKPCAKSGYSAYIAGSAPDGIFDGLYSCGLSMQSTKAFYNETSPTAWSNADFANVSWFNVQGQTMASENPWDVCYGTVAGWLASDSQLIALLRANNPGITIGTEVSFGNEDEYQQAAMIQASEAQKNAGGVGPDYYTVDFPTARPPCPPPNVAPTPSPHSWKTRCSFATVAALQNLAYLIGRPTPIPSASPSPSPTPTASPSPSPSPTPSSGPTPMPSPTISSGPTPMPSPTISSGPTPAPSPTASSGPTPMPSPTLGPTPAPSPT